MTQENTALLEALDRCDQENRTVAVPIDLYRQVVAALSSSTQSSGEARILKGVGKITGDGWKDVTVKGEIVYVWNSEMPPPYAPGQYPRVGNEVWSASTEQYDFIPATADELRQLFAYGDTATPDVSVMREDLEIVARLLAAGLYSTALSHASAALSACTPTTQTVPADVAALVVAAREAVQCIDYMMPILPDELYTLNEVLEPFASRVCWDDEGGSPPDAHAVPCSCGKGGRGQQPLRDALIQDAIDNGEHGKAARMAALAQPKGGEG